MIVPAITIRGLARMRGRVPILDGLDLTIGEGEIVGLVGPSGSGKTTALLAVLGLVRPDAGSIDIFGFDPVLQPLAVRGRVGFIPEGGGFERHLSARDNLAYGARLAGFSTVETRHRVDAALDWAGLTAFARRRSGTLRPAEIQRLGLADLKLRQCRIGLIDEPASGVEPAGMARYFALLSELRGAGMTLVLASRDIDRIRPACDRVVVLERGRAGLTGTPDDLAGRLLGGTLLIRVEAAAVDFAAVLDGLSIGGITPVEGGAEIVASGDLRPEIAMRISAAGGALRAMTLRPADLGSAVSRHRQEPADAA